MAGKAQLSAFVVVLALTALARPALAQTCAPPAPDKGQDHIWLYPQSCGPATSAGACYSVSGATDPWKDESYQQTGGSSLALTIANQDQHENMTCAVLVIAIHGETTASQLASLTFEDAIRRHRGEASAAAFRFKVLAPRDREALLEFLRSL